MFSEKRDPHVSSTFPHLANLHVNIDINSCTQGGLSIRYSCRHSCRMCTVRLPTVHALQRYSQSRRPHGLPRRCLPCTGGGCMADRSICEQNDRQV